MYVAASYARDIRAIFEKDLDIVKIILLVLWLSLKGLFCLLRRPMTTQYNDDMVRSILCSNFSFFSSVCGRFR